MLNKHIAVFLGVLFFIIGFLTLSDYGIIWDAPTHYWRGQGYLRYILTGEKDYKNLKVRRRSFYQSNRYPAAYYLNRNKNIGHPPLNSILASISNTIFYQKLGILGDIESYHLFIIFASSLLVLGVVYFTYEVYGLFASLIAFLSISLYPLFLAESHFNIKDPVEASFFALTIITFYQGIKNKSWKWILLSSLFCGMALSTKLNIVFVPFIILPWLIVKYLPEIKKYKAKTLIKIFSMKDKKYLSSFIIYPFVVFGVLFLSLPNLWKNTLTNFKNILFYYKNIGYGTVYQPENYITNYGFNTYVFTWISYTTPLIILFLAFLGIIASFFLIKKEKHKTSLLVFLWLTVPILRASFPKIGIYGGSRQIMEYIPAMAILTGIGAYWLRKQILQLPGLTAIFTKKKLEFIIFLIIILSFIPITIKMIKIHPNQNVYFNPLIGGLKGAKEKNIPDWGNSFGNVYKEAVIWLNKNAEENAKVVLAVGYEDAMPKIWLRNDILYSNKFRSGLEKKGEYVVELTNDMGWPDFCYWIYVQNFLEPVYEKRVDDTALLKIWKNDIEHTKKEFISENKTFLLDDCIIRKE